MNRSWNFAPEIIDERGCAYNGYKKNEKAYHITKTSDLMQFRIAASKESPVVNPAFVIKNWDKAGTEQVDIKINGMVISDIKAVCKGIESDTDGKPMLVIWLKYSAEEHVSIEIKSNFK